MLSRQDFFKIVRQRVKEDITTEQLYSAYEIYLICPKAASMGYIISGISSQACYRCGNCCRKPWRIEASLYDVLRWIREGRFDILADLRYVPRRKEDETAPNIKAQAIKMVELMAGHIAGCDRDLMAKAAFAIFAASRDDGCLVLPKSGEGGCIYHMDNGISSCGIHGTKPEVCMKFPKMV
ncbi:hypothetical protein CUJ83_14650 [Methanocella sp. CWC-04]|uniref:Uncharacterized protein n=1 Tax=Methanooceanicella nereidis TaxID=2052831 RepID=A0AAP2REH8_9EURY|nr:YkgJ family cysteine cluster protein [Methanocella sp. CWC-04]MCD1296239.1 hypothetical protein [Methanocella sp. CWC-04]